MTKPAFRKPWQHGAYAYAQADTFAALAEGMKRVRKIHTVHMPNTGEAGDMPCAHCGIALNQPSPDRQADGKIDEYSTWTWLPKSKSAYGSHYTCSWGALLKEIYDLGCLMRF